MSVDLERSSQSTAVDLEAIADELIAELEAEKIWAMTLMADGVRMMYKRICERAEGQDNKPSGTTQGKE